jgi:hypothetical protein
MMQVGFHLGLAAARFMGNSASTFSAMMMLERGWMLPAR